MIYLKNVSVPNLCDAGAKLLKDIKPINTDQKIVYGEAITVKTKSDDWGTSVKSISYGKNKIIVVSCNNDDFAVWGGLATLNAKIKGVKGVVIDGSVRDLEEINKLKFPIFSKSTCAIAGKPKNEGNINVSINISNVVINPGDIIVGDCNGVVVIEKNKIEEILNNVKLIKRKEGNIRKKIMNGFDLEEILKLY